MLRRMDRSTLFTSDLTGRSDAARMTWGLQDSEVVDWRTAIVERTPAQVREALQGLEKDQPARQIIEEQDREVAEKSGKPALAIKTLVRA